MVVLTARHLRRSFGIRQVLDDVNVALDEGERAGLVGRNGSGKSTLARLLAGLDEPDAGEVVARRDATVGVLEQVPSLAPDRTAREVVLDGLATWREARRRWDRCAEQLAAGGGDPGTVLAEQAAAAEAIERLGGWEMEHEADAVLGHVGVPDPDRRTGTLSGGERRRVALARLLVSRPTVAILDEPTNHLDVETIEWLERYLVDCFGGAVLLVTHDRWLLDRVAQRTWEIDDGILYRYDGGYGAYLEAKAERLAHARRSEANRQNLLRRELEWLRRQPKARTGKQKARAARAEAARDVEAPREARVADLRATTTRTGKTILDLEHLRIELGGRVLVDDLTLALGRGDRVGIVGRKRHRQDHPAADDPERATSHRRRGAAGQEHPPGLPRPDPLGPARRGHRVRGSGRRPQPRRGGHEHDGGPRLPRAVPVRGPDPAPEGRHPLGRRAGTGGPGPHAVGAGQPARARRADQRSGRRHPRRPRGAPARLRRDVPRGDPRPLAARFGSPPRSSRSRAKAGCGRGRAAGPPIAACGPRPPSASPSPPRRRADR